MNGAASKFDVKEFNGVPNEGEKCIMTKQGVKVKQVRKIGQKVTFYSAFCGAGELALTLIDINPEETLMKRFQSLSDERVTVYPTREVDRQLYERDELAKITSEEIMRITLNFDEVKNGCVDPKAYRSMIRFDNEVAKFENLEREMREVS
jgi:hypothetical protein